MSIIRTNDTKSVAAARTMAPASNCIVNAQGRASSAQTADETKPVLIWSLGGQGGASSKITFELSRAILQGGWHKPSVVAAEGTELVPMSRELPDLDVYTIRTFRGSTTGLWRKVEMVHAIMRLLFIKHRFRNVVDEVSPKVLLCTFSSIWDIAILDTLLDPNKRFILILHDATIHPGDWYPFRTTIVRKMIDSADGLIVLSDFVRKEAISHYNFAEDRVWTVKHGSFSFGDSKIRSRKYPTRRPFRLLFLGRIARYKGLDLLLEAFHQLLDRGADMELEIVGSGSMSPKSQKLSSIPQVKMTNRWVSEDEIAQALDRSDLVVLPYVEASQSGIAAAAMSVGLPIVATPVGGLPEQVLHDVTGLIADEISSSAVADAIERIANSQELYERFSVAAVDYVETHCGWETIGRETERIIDEIGKRPRRSQP